MDMRIIIPALFALVLAIGWALPDFSQKTPAPQDMVESEARVAQQQTPAPAANGASGEAAYSDDSDFGSGWGGEVSLQREADGHFYASVSVNGQEIDFLVDTGATAIALTGDDASALGLYYDPNNAQVVGRGASGNVYGTPVVLEEVTLGEFTAYNVPAAIIHDGLDKSLLGQAFLKQIPNVNISGDEMRLSS